MIQLERVRCLECGSTYVKPADGGTVHENPGCPECGYVGWISTKIPDRRSIRLEHPRMRAADGASCAASDID